MPATTVPTPSGHLALDDLTRDLAIDVLLDGPISRADLARRHDLAPGTVTRLMAPLLRAGLITEAEADSLPAGKLGRPSKPLSFATDTHRFVGLKLAGDRVGGVLVDVTAQIQRFDEVELPAKDVASVVEAIAGLVAPLADGVTPAAIGIGLGGGVADGGLVRRAPFLGWQDVPLGPLVAARLGVPTTVTNDVAGLTEAEHWFGAGHGLPSFAVITLGVGVGYGLVANGRLVQSPDYGVGLIGHMPLDPAGPRCSQGHVGCAAAMLTDGGVSTTISAAAGRTVGFDEGLNLALDGDPAARAVVAASGRALGKLVATVANLAMPARIIITGEAVRLAEVAAREVAEGVRADREPLADEVDYLVAPAGPADWARGAAVIAIQRFMLG